MNKEFSRYLDRLTADADLPAEEEVAHVLDRIRAKEDLAGEDVSPPPQKPQTSRKWWKPVGLIAACALVAVGVFALLPAGDKSGPAVSSGPLVYAAEDYGDVYKAITAAAESKGSDYGYYAVEDSGMMLEDANGAAAPTADAPAAAEEDMEMPTSDEAANATGYGDAPTGTEGPGGMGGETEYSDTNTQVAGVDEADIVKTDGEYIYLLRNGHLIIASAKGAESEILSNTELTEGGEDTYEYYSEMFLSGDTLAVVCDRYEWSPYVLDGGYWGSADKDTVYVYFYDVSDPTAPALSGKVGQDGGYTDSRMVDGVIYLVSTYGVYNYYGYVEEQPESYVPCVYGAEDSSLIAPEDISICEEMEDTRYLVVSVISTTDQDVLDTKTVLGGGDIVYMTADSLYVADTVYESNTGSSYTSDQYTVTEYTEESNTNLLKFELTDSSVALTASKKLNGYLESQFSMDEYDGYLRLVLTIENWGYKVYQDEKYGWENYEWQDDDNVSNALYVLDGALEPVGRLEDLAKDEYIRSARFDGDICYFVTFRQTDPLFAADLSDPTSPQILSALKIPGFSEYLHFYTEDRLFGLGMDADIDTGGTRGLKLTMFNVADPQNVTEKHTLLLEDYYSEGLYNHKAILISAAKDLIAFPVSGGYSVYGYDDDRGFYEKGRFDTGDWYGDTRGLFIDNDIYICGYDTIIIVDMDTLGVIGKLSFDAGNDEPVLYYEDVEVEDLIDYAE